MRFRPGGLTSTSTLPPTSTLPSTSTHNSDLTQCNVPLQSSAPAKSAESPAAAAPADLAADPPFEWVEFRKADGRNCCYVFLQVKLTVAGEIVKGTVLPSLHGPASGTQRRAGEQEAGVAGNKEKKRSVACDAGTQTEKPDKKGGCSLM